MRATLSLLVTVIMLLQAIPVAIALIPATGTNDAPVEIQIDSSEYSASGAKLNDLWLQSPRATGIPLSYDDVMLVINDASQMSKDIGAYFLAHRPIPQANICNFTTSTSEHINKNTYDTSVQPGVEACLNKNGLKDKINFLVTTKGFPLGISGLASVDSELSLILGPYNGSIGGSGRIKNPYFNKDEPFSHAKFGTFLVTRLTGYDLNDVKHLIDLADNSTGKRGIFLLDEGAKGGGYQSGDIWINDANTTLVNKGFNTSHDKSGTFQMNYQNVSGYASWGSNDGNYWSSFGQNTGFETDSNADGIPDNWVVEKDGATMTRSSVTKQSGTYSFQIVRGSQTAGESIIGQNLTIPANTRYWLTGTANLSSISNPGGGAGAHLFIRAYNSANKLVATLNSSSYTGNQNWFWTNQIHYEPIVGVTKIMIGGSVFKSSGTAYFDEVSLHIIKPNNTYVPGAIGETYVSTGGRSFTYGTDYGQSLVVDLIREGISGVSGHVYEPYLDACGHPDIMFDRYTSAYTMAESFWMALYYLSWMEVVAGDPKMVPYWNIPDPMVDETNITVTPSDPAIGEEVTLRARVFGHGETVSNVEIDFYNGVKSPANKIGSTFVIPSLARNAESWVEMKYTFTQVKSALLSVSVDPANKIRELSEVNNDGSLAFSVGYRPDLAVTDADIQFSLTDILQGEQVGLTVNAANIGGVSTNLTGWANLTYPNGTTQHSYALIQNGMALNTNATVLDTVLDTTDMAGALCVNVTLFSSRFEDALNNNIAGTCFFVKHLEFSVEQLTHELIVPPLDYKMHSFNITNLANIEDTFYIAHEESNSLWGIDISQVSIVLSAGAKTTVSIKTLSTASLNYGDKLTINITVTSKSTAVAKKMTFTSITGPTYEVSITSTETELEAMPGTNATINVSIGNMGNTEDFILLSAMAPDGWVVLFDQVNTTLVAGQFTQRKATVKVLNDAPAGDIGEIVLTASSGKGTSTMITKSYITILASYKLSLTPSAMAVVAGSGATNYLKVTNFGNAKDKIHLLAAAPPFLTVEFLDNDMTLDAGATRTDIGIRIMSSKIATVGAHLVTIRAVSLGGQVAQTDMDVKVIKPELTIKIYEAPDPKVKEGTKVSFKLEILSTGEYAVPRANVSFSIGSKLIQTRQAEFGGASKTELTFTWTATTGTHQAVFIVDPEDSLAEINETDNRATFSIKVEAKSIIGGGNGGSFPVWAIVVVIVLVAVGYLGVKTLIWSRRLKAAAKDGEEKRARTAKDEPKPRDDYPDDDKPTPPTDGKAIKAPMEEPPKKEVPTKDPPTKDPPTTEPPTVEKTVEAPKADDSPKVVEKTPQVDKTPEKIEPEAPVAEKPQSDEDPMSNLEKLMKEMNAGK